MKRILYILLFLLSIQTVAQAQLYLNELMPANDATIMDASGEFDDWLEIYNAGSSMNLAGYYLTDNQTLPTKWQIPTGFPAQTTIASNSHLLFWMDEDTLQGATHCNFKLSASGETVYLFDSDGITLIDSLMFNELEADESLGRFPDGSSIINTFFPASPGMPNIAPRAEAPIISLSEGVYSGSQTISIQSSSPAVSIYYTLDSAIPTASSILYTGPFVIDSTLSIRTIAIGSGYTDSKITTQNYLLDVNHDLPIVYISTDPDNLWDDSIGIHTIGVNGVYGPCLYDSIADKRNWWREWKRQAHVTLVEQDGSIGFSVGCGLEVAGSCTRNRAQKSFNLSFKSQYGVSELDYKVFPTQPETKWDGIKLRNLGSYDRYSRIREHMSHHLIENKLNVDIQSQRYTVVYLNGEYWGIYNLRDKHNEDYMYTHYPKIDHKNVDIIKYPMSRGDQWWWIKTTVQEGDSIDFYNLYSFMKNNDLNLPANWAIIEEKVDVDNFLDYYVSQIFYNAADWPANNLAVWKEKTPDEKWRWITFDMDNAARNASLDILGRNLCDSCDLRATPEGTLPFRMMVENDWLRGEFIQRTNTYAKVLWDTARVRNLVSNYKAEIVNEVQADIDKWWPAYTYATWENWVENCNTFYEDRPATSIAHMQSNWNLGGLFELTLNFDASTNGTVRLHSNYFEVPYNFIQNYFESIPIQVNAVPNKGYRFSHWLETGSTNPILIGSYTSDQTLTPVFLPAEDLVINELYYNPPNSTDSIYEFIEIFNPDAFPKDLSKYKLSDGACFTFPDGATIAPNEYVVIARDSVTYANNGYQVFEWYRSKLSNNGEAIVLVNPLNEVIDSVSYSDTAPWNSDADGNGYSLALLNPAMDNLLAANWQTQPVNLKQTPGAANVFCTTINYTNTTSQPECPGINDGSITINATSANSPFNYAWSHGPLSNSVSSLSPGTYICAIMDSLGCETADTTVINSPSAPNSIGLNLVTITDNYLIANWSALSNNVNYYLQYRQVGAANWNTYSTGSTAAIISNLTTCTDYEIRIGGDCSADGSSNFNPIQTFTTTGCFVCTSPLGLYQFNIQNISAIITWDVLVGASSYTYKFRKVGDLNWISQTTTFPIAVLFGISGCSDYEWTMETTCYDGSTAQSSTINTFSTLCKTDNPANLNSDSLNSSIWPNPASNVIFVQYSSKSNGSIAVIRDISGRIVKEEAIYTGVNKLYIDDLLSGIYTLQIDQESFQFIVK